MKNICRNIIIFALAVFGATSQMVAGSSPQQTEFILLGTLHDMHMKAEMNYSLHDLRRQIELIKPDLISIEIEPKAYHAPMEGYFPPEAAYIATFAAEMGIRTVPSDWRIAKTWQDRAEKQVSPEMAAKISIIQNQISDSFIKASEGESIYDFTHTDFQKMVDIQFHDIIGENNPADISMGAWQERNRRIIENTLEAKGDAKRVLIIYGAAHLPQLARELQFNGYASQISPRLFKPSGFSPLPKSVIIRWQRNLDNLVKIKNGALKVSKDDYEKVKASKRIENLMEAISVYGK